MKKGQVAVVTGGASGIGSGMCGAFARAGLSVVVADIDAAGAENLAAKLRDEGACAVAAEVDVTRADSVDSLADLAFQEFGAVHVLCNNAGVIGGGNIADATEDDWRWMLDVNVGGVANGCRSFVPRLLEQGQAGHIVNTASVGGFVSGPGLGVYCATKFAVVALSDSLRYELSETDIGVSTLCPGAVKTNLYEADRSRPESLSDTAGRADVMRIAIETGSDPIEVGESVLRGIRVDAPYIFTHSHYRQAFETRFNAVLAAFDT